MDNNELDQNNNTFNYLAQDSTNKSSILAQNEYKAERKLKLRWIIAISCFPLFGIYAAFGIAPQTITEKLQTTTVIEEISLPAIQNNPLIYARNDNLAMDNFWYKERVRPDDTLNNVLSRLNIKNQDAIEYIRRDDTASEIASSLKPGREINSQTDYDGNLISLEYHLDTDSYILIKKNANGYESKKITPLLEKRPILKSADIKNSLFGATDDANIPDQIAIQIAEIFESQIDFHSDLRRGDHFNVIYEGIYDQGELVKTGDVLAVEFVNKRLAYRAVGYRDYLNEMHYYTPEGQSLHKSFLRSPLEFTRISSSFSLGRFHPILQRIKAHKGVDMAAPIGTRIKASGDATVEFVGQKGGYGNLIMLNHANGIRTIYGHLSRFANGLHRGERVAQGDIIGYVGMTGLATGPHLHYEFLLNGEHRDPMTVALPNAAPIAGNLKDKFYRSSSSLISQLKLLGTSNIAALD